MYFYYVFSPVVILTSLATSFNSIHSLNHISLLLIFQLFTFHFSDHMATPLATHHESVNKWSTYGFAMKFCLAASVAATSACCADIAVPCSVITIPSTGL